MPFDGQNFPKPDPYSLGTFIAWLKTMPRHKKYEFMNCNGGCLVGQYAEAMGIPDEWSLLHWGKTLEGTELGRVAVGWPRTFGAALFRARWLRIRVRLQNQITTTYANIKRVLEKARL